MLISRLVDVITGSEAEQGMGEGVRVGLSSRECSLRQVAKPLRLTPFGQHRPFSALGSSTSRQSVPASDITLIRESRCVLYCKEMFTFAGILVVTERRRNLRRLNHQPDLSLPSAFSDHITSQIKHTVPSDLLNYPTAAFPVA